MVSSCKSYVTDDGLMTIWDQPRDEVIAKLEACIKLNRVSRCFSALFKHNFTCSVQDRLKKVCHCIGKAIKMLLETGVKRENCITTIRAIMLSN